MAIVCRGVQMNCYARAGEVCPTGYEIADTAGHEGQASSGFANRRAAVYSSQHTYDGEMLIHCKGPPVNPPAPPARECLDDNSCDSDQRCVFTAGIAIGHCT